MDRPANTEASNFIRNIIDEDLASGKHTGDALSSRAQWLSAYWPRKSICLNFAGSGLSGLSFRFDDTNPPTRKYMESIGM